MTGLRHLVFGVLILRHGAVDCPTSTRWRPELQLARDLDRVKGTRHG